MGKHFDIGYFKKKIKVRSKVAKKEQSLINIMHGNLKKNIMMGID